MKIIRVRLKNFGGVKEAEVAFAATGVTIIHGPNESGKSTLMRGIDVLFEHRDDSRKEEVRNTKPVDRDVGSEVEADVEIGEHRFTYFKRFHRDRETRLTIHAPSPANLTGREAHERVQEILGANVDTTLWRALRIVQGEHPDMPPLNDQPALAMALDRAAGETKSGEREEGLFEAARAEYERYFTEAGREREDPVVAARTRAEDAEASVNALRTQLSELETDITRCAITEKAVANLKRSIPSLDGAVEKARAGWLAVSALAERAQQSVAAHESSVKAVKAAREAQESRFELIRSVESVGAKARAAESTKSVAEEEVAQAAKVLEAARRERETANAAVVEKDAEERLRREDYDLQVDEFELVRLEERLEHVRRADEAAISAESVVASTKVSKELRERIREAEVELRTKRGIFSASSPKLAIRALRDLPFAINGTLQSLAADESREIGITESTTLAIADTVELTVSPGTSAEELREEVERAEGALARACANAGVATAVEAEAAWASLQDAQRMLAERDRIAKEHLRDLSREALGKNIASGKARVDAYRKRRSSALAMPPTTEEAKALLEIAVREAGAARKALQQAEAAHAPAQEHHAACREAYAARVALLSQAGEDLAIAVKRLESERQRICDDELVKVLEAEEASAKVAQEGAKAAQASLGRGDVESEKSFLDASEFALTQARNQLEEKQGEYIALRTKLDLNGERGLGEGLAEAERQEFEAKDALERLLRRARAANLLYEMLRSERDAMRRAYVAPLQDGIERLGRHVFGPDLHVELNDSLQIVSRTLDGITVPLALLSTGAREQMGILVRMAAVALVSKGGAVPLVLDDALGASDEGRLASMSAALRIASFDAQTIILTSTPERYIHIGAAATIPL